MFYRTSFRFLAMLFLLSGISMSAQTFWMQHAGSATIDEGMDVAVDGSGNTFSTGYFTSTATFGSSSLSSSGVDDIYLARLGTNGLYQWIQKAGGTGSDRALSVKADAAGNSYITGFFHGTATFGSQSVTAAGAQDVFIAKYDPSGTCLWVKSGGGANADIGNGITVDNSGNVIVTGEFAGTATFGSFSLTSMNGSTDVFTTKLDASGNFLWAKKGTAPLTDRGIDVDCDASGNIYVTGQFSDSITFDVTHNNNMLNAIFLISYDPSGNEQWFRVIGGGVVNISNSIACNGAGGIFLTGDFQGTLTFFGSTNTNLSATYANCIFIARYDQSGNLVWDAAESSDSPLTSRSITADANSCFIAGNFKCTFDSYSDRYGSGIFNSSGYWDIFEGKYDASSGSWGMSRQLGGKKDQNCNGIAVDAAGNPHVTGSYVQSLVVPVDPSFYGFIFFTGYGMTMNTDVATSTVYCSDPYYNSYAVAPAVGNADIFIGDPFDPARAPYDFYWRNGSGCVTPWVDLCIHRQNNYDYDCFGDTLDACTVAHLMAATQTSLFSPANSVGPDFTYQWSNGATSPTTNISTTGYCWATITSADGCYTREDSIYVIIHPPPPIPTISDNVGINNNSTNPQLVEICGDSVILTGGNLGSNTYGWTGPQFDPSFSGSNPVTIDSSGNYVLTVVDQYGCKNTDTVPVLLDHPLQQIIPDIYCLDDSDQNDSITVCDGTNIHFMPYDSLTNPNALPECIDQLTVVAWHISPGNPNAIISDSTDCQSILNAISTAIVHQTGWYTITEIIIRNNLCGNDTVTYSHNYYFDILPVPPPGSLPMVITGDSLFCPGDSAMLVVTGGANYLWNTNSTNDTIYTTLPGNYYVQGIDTVTNSYGCSTVYYGYANAVVNMTPQPVVTSLPADGTICPGDSVELMSTGNGNFAWNGPNGPIATNSSSIWVTSPGTYYCIVTDPSGCTLLSNSVILQQYNTPGLSLSPSSVLCPGDTVVLTVNSNNGSTITWLPPLSGNSLTQYITQPGTYSCSIQSCSIPTNLSVTIVPAQAVAMITPLTSTVACEGDSILLGANTGMNTYNWQPGNSSALTIYAHNSGMYYLTTTDTGGCVARDSFAVQFTQNLLQPPAVTDTTICAGKPVLLIAGGTPVINWYLTPSGGTPFTTGPYLQLPAVFADTAFYLLSDDSVCRSGYSVIRVHTEECTPLTPNVFTPDGDGVNDVWALYEPYAAGIRVRIYDRWGVLVYEYGDLDGYWDGTYMKNGKPVTDGVYYYIGDVDMGSGNVEQKTGFVQLIRNGGK
ncbi:MAG TPA: gliding motility-associated C-terminal domain-containing protein [Bacteroidia bacterium]|nr:gliding motility-associated C-terminal domain-containing protein [Bacteroidia bacterium]